MSIESRTNWSHHVDQILRSRHYTWIAEGLGGAPLRDAMLSMTTDLIHMCHRAGISWDELAADSDYLCRCEENQKTKSPANAA